jgi:hypothetical protein
MGDSYVAPLVVIMCLNGTFTHQIRLFVTQKPATIVVNHQVRLGQKSIVSPLNVFSYMCDSLTIVL